MPKFPIDLGRKLSKPEAMPESSPTSGKSYPNLYLDWDAKYNLPESGEMTVKFVKTNESTSKDKSGERQSVTLEIREICGVEGKKSDEEKDEDEDGGKALDRLKEEAEEYED